MGFLERELSAACLYVIVHTDITCFVQMNVTVNSCSALRYAILCLSC